MLQEIVLTIITASTPLLLAAIGELVVERSGVLNLGVEGMMVMGAVTGFAVASVTGSLLLGTLAALAGGMVLALFFGLLTLTFIANQVATGLALTLLGLGLSGLIGESFVGQPGARLPKLDIPGVSDTPSLAQSCSGRTPSSICHSHWSPQSAMRSSAPASASSSAPSATITLRLIYSVIG